MQHDEWLIKENISQLRQLMSDQNLQLLPDYEQRLQVLKDLGFIDDSSRVLLKGKVACEVRSNACFCAYIPPMSWSPAVPALTCLAHLRSTRPTNWF